MASMVEEVLIQDTRARVLAWFEEAGRDLPWRAPRDPYRVLGRSPAARALPAPAPAEVLRAWQGLGYNRRALALRATAQAVQERGGWPGTVEGLAALPAVGPYTARAGGS